MNSEIYPAVLIFYLAGNKSYFSNTYTTYLPSDQYFKSIFEENYPSLAVYARTILSYDHQEAEDIVSEAFLGLYNRQNDFNSPKHIKSFLYTVVKNRCINAIRNRSIKQRLEPDISKSIEEAETRLIQAEIMLQIWKAIELLPPKRKEVFELHFQKNYSIGEIANRLQIPYTEVAFQLHLARQHLRKIIERPGVNKQSQKIESKKFCIRVSDGRIQLIYEQADNFTLVNGLYVYTKSKWSIVLGELEKLINKPDLKERELQDFFETYPELIIDDQYNCAIPQATIVKDDTTLWKADFILVPSDQLSFSKILELKLPNEKISLQSRSGHCDFSKKLFKAIHQLIDYYKAFDSDLTKNRFKEIYQAEIFKPDLQLVFGRRGSIVDNRNFLDLQRRNNLKIIDWDSLYEQLKRRYK